jgi:hypothetical protein
LKEKEKEKKKEYEDIIDEDTRQMGLWKRSVMNLYGDGGPI